MKTKNSMNNPNNTIAVYHAEALLTRAEVASYCRVSKETIRRWEGQGRITPRIINARVYRYKLAEIAALFDA